MKKLSYLIDGVKHSVSVEGSPETKFGNDERLSKIDTDITYSQSWYKKGYSTADILDVAEFETLKKGLTSSIGKIIQDELSIDVSCFNLVNYHNYVKNDTDHFKIVSKTRDLFAEDFNFPVMELTQRFEKILGFKLTDIHNVNGKKTHIIVRVNRPNSNDFNPPHKDVYEGVDNDNVIPKFVNFWIPIAGVTNKSSLPIVPESHVINEKEVLRTFTGGVMENNKYRVRMIESWNGENNLERSKVGDGQVLVFSGHLIHGLAINEEEDSTRVALEFRLFKAD
jgi:hypothetical protein